MHLPTTPQLPQHRHLQRLLHLGCIWYLRSFGSRGVFVDAVAGRAEDDALSPDGIGGLVVVGVGVDDGEEVFALEGEEEAGAGAAVAVVDDAGVDEGAEEGDAGRF